MSWSRNTALRLTIITSSLLINLGSCVDLSISVLAETVAAVVGYQGWFVQDIIKPDGTMCKIMKASKLRQLGWSLRADLPTCVALAFTDYLNGYKQ